MQDFTKTPSPAAEPVVETPAADAPAQAGQAPQAKQPEAPDVKKIVNALLVALEHKYGRKPTPEELAEALQTKEDPLGDEMADHQAQQQAEEEQLPKVLRMKAYYGMSNTPDGQRQPDPERTLYYENHDGTQWFDVDQGVWLGEQPPMCEHLPCRVLGDSDSQRDIFDAIVHGVVDDDDYNLLHGRNMLDGRCEKAWELTKRARQQFDALQAMEKSLVPAPVEEDPLSSEPPMNNMQTILSAAGIENAEPEEQEPVDYEKAGGGQVMVESALAAGLEPRARKWIQEEIQAALPMIAEYLMQMFSGEEAPTQAGDGVEAPVESPAQPL